MRTHYANLKVAENASREEIKAAYRKLSLRHHPDRDPQNPEAKRIMQILNDAYGVLHDPVKRREYDLHLMRTRAATTRPSPPPGPARQAQPYGHAYHTPWQQPSQGPVYHHRYATHAPRRRYSRSFAESFFLPIVDLLVRNIRLTAAIAVLLYMSIAAPFGKPRSRLPFQDDFYGASKMSSSSPTDRGSNYFPFNLFPSHSGASRKELSSDPAYTRPATAPNGYPWPTTASYVQGYEQLATAGASQVFVDNSHNRSDMLVKLVSLHSGIPYPVRVCFIPALSQFAFSDISPGEYDIRFCDLKTGILKKTEPFELNESLARGLTQYTALRLTLSQFGRGNIPTEEIASTEF